MTEGSGVAASAMEYGSDSDEDMIPNPCLDNTWRGDGDSDAESIHSEEEDNVLKHAGVYTAEEVVSITKDKMIRLRKLYEQQYKRLQNQLKESKRKYLVAVRQEKDFLPSIHDCPKDTAEEKQAYEELKALLRYHKLHGKEALLQRNKWLKRQKETEGGNNHRVNVGLRCLFTEGGVRCSTKPLPLSKYCLKHILHDPHQVLYRACGWDNGDNACLEPVLSIDSETRCLLHTRMEPLFPVAGPSKPNTETKPQSSSDPPSVS